MVAETYDIARLSPRLPPPQFVVPTGGNVTGAAGSDGVLDFGTLGVGESRDMFYYLLNENPISVQLQGWGSNLSRSVVELVGTDSGGVTEILRRHGAATYRRKHVSGDWGRSAGYAAGLPVWLFFKAKFLKKI